jgi:hypothetical protein
VDDGGSPLGRFFGLFRNNPGLPAGTVRIRELLGIREPREARSLSIDVPVHLVGDYLRALQELPVQWNCTLETEDIVPQTPMYDPSLEDLWRMLLEGMAQVMLVPAQQTSLPVGPDTYASLPARALHMLRHPEHPTVYFIMPPTITREQAKLCAYVRDGEEAVAWLSATLSGLTKWVRRNTCYRRHVLQPSIDGYRQTISISYMDLGSLDDMQLDPDVERQLEENFLVFKREEKRLTEMGVETHRGLLFCGPPGNGKTSTLRFLKRALPEHTFLVPALAALGRIGTLFELAKFLAPALVVLEDVDLYLMARDVNPFVSILGQLMNEVDGLQPRDQVDVIMTSNSWKAIEEALARRPGRIDQVIQFDNPGAQQRMVLLGKFLRGLTHSADIKRLVALTDGMAVAQIKEVVKKAVAHALAARGGAAVTVEPADFERAAQAVRENPFRPVGVRPRGMRRDPDALKLLSPVADPPDDDEPESN